MSEVSMLTFWRGRNVDELTRDQAIEALKECGAMLRAQHEKHMSAWRTMREFNEMRLRRS